ncbi:hypothetical protein FOZ60_010281 [Perkinsus olseni]|uniref:Uncharacterized protein n=1 Tax=Perkinsus olseni TaxID=32597 RepID=A0A7J6NGP9_PEROL|nr:hypothetical protein FOZ60_010281 [Perkinsus olseni]
MIIASSQTTSKYSAAALLHFRRAFSGTVKEQAKLLEATKWDKLPEGDWLRQDPKGTKKTLDCRSIAALQNLSELFWDDSALQQGRSYSSE